MKIHNDIDIGGRLNRFSEGQIRKFYNLKIFERVRIYLIVLESKPSIYRFDLLFQEPENSSVSTRNFNVTFKIYQVFIY